MSIKATFPTGHTEITVNGLHQWDYGQQLEIECADLPALVEVHFAHEGMSEAVVRVCNVSAEGVLTASIPDRCLEQTSPVYAWVVLVDETSGTTVLTVTLPITARSRPAAGASVPEEISDKYTESIAAINAQIATLKAGNITVSKAENATSAGYANLAHQAERAYKADEATTAQTAASASLASRLNTGAYTQFSSTYGGFKISDPGLYLCISQHENFAISGVICIPRTTQTTVGSSVHNSGSAGDISLVYDADRGAAYFDTTLAVSSGTCYRLMSFAIS